MSMRICQIHLGTAFGGAERLFIDLSCELMRAGVSVGAICRPGFKGLPQLEQAGVVCETLSEYSSWDALACYRIRRFVRRFGGQLMHTHLSRATRLASWAFLNIPVVSSIHHYGSWRYYKHANYYMPISKYGEDFVRYHGVSNERIRRVSNFTCMPAGTREWRYPCQPYRLLAYGRFVEEKGFQDLIDACWLLRKQGVNLRLKLAGDGVYQDILRLKIIEYGLQDYVDLIGWVDDIAAQLDEADLFVLPSRKEPFGLVLLEAMARKVPIVSTRAEGPAEIFSENEINFCEVASHESLAKAIRASLEEPELSFTRVSNAFQTYQDRFTPAVVIPHVVNHYQNILTTY